MDVHYTPSQIITAPDDALTVRVSISPHEPRGGSGADRRVDAVCFETTDGEWIGSVPVYQGVTLRSLSDDDLIELLDQAVSQG